MPAYDFAFFPFPLGLHHFGVLVVLFLQRLRFLSSGATRAEASSSCLWSSLVSRTNIPLVMVEVEVVLRRRGIELAVRAPTVGTFLVLTFSYLPLGAPDGTARILWTALRENVQGKRTHGVVP